ncbi:MAG: DUF1501 domain-containing protein [Planctomycetes bacterium]|nr:DUF1501 domain-containing protein [Planctomycetota bacterium]
MRVGGLSALGLTLADWLSAEAAGAVGKKASARSVILIFNSGAPSHLDLWDMKPEAGETVSGVFRPIRTNVPGIEISELLPHLAQHADKFAIVRTVHHNHTQHNSGMYWSIVGRPYPLDNTLINPGSKDYPSFGTLVGWLAQREGYHETLPPYVITPAPHCDSLVYITPGQFGGFLGRKYDPFVLNSDPNAPDFKVPNLSLLEGVTLDRTESRRVLLDCLDQTRHRLEGAGLQGYDTAQEKAFALVTSPEARRAFDLSQEPPQVRDRYGRNPWGQSHLLARRLVESGVRFVTTVNGPSIVWDTHKDNFNLLKSRLVPPMEQAFAALLEDLAQRGLLESTLVVWMGDFGRTPMINKDAGRDHWPHCYSLVLAGGGIRGGQVIGQSDRIGAHPVSRPVSPADIHATVFAALGHDPHTTTYPSAEGRPLPLSEGQPIRELL